MLFKSLVYLILLSNVVGLPSSWRNSNIMRSNQFQEANLPTVPGNNAGELTKLLNGNEINWNVDDNAADFESAVDVSSEELEKEVNSATSPLEDENLDDKWALDNDEFGDYLILKGTDNKFYGDNALVRDTVERALQQNPGITRIKISDGVKVIGHGAFEDLSNVDQISLNKIPTCKNITQIDIPDSVTNIFNDAFAGCTALTELKLPKNLKTIQRNAFENCKSLTSISIPESVQAIYSGAFYGCESLTDVNIDTKPNKIAINAFLNCKNIKHITAPHSFSSLKFQFPDAIIDYNDTEKSYLETINKARREAHKLTSELSSSLNFSDLLKSYKDRHEEVINMHNSLCASDNHDFSLAINKYIEYYGCNGALRSKNKIETCKDFLAEMDGIFDQELPLEKGQEFYVYRGVSKDFLEWLLDINNVSTPFGITNNKVKQLIGAVFSDPAHLSTSLDASFAHDWRGPVTMRIYLPKGSKVLAIGGNKQLEVLLDRNSKIKIKDIQIIPHTKKRHYKEYFIDAELIPDTPGYQNVA